MRLLLLVWAVGGNVPIRPLLDERVFATVVVVAKFYDRRTALQPHQLVVNAIGDADLCAPGLEAAAAIPGATAGRSSIRRRRCSPPAARPMPGALPCCRAW